MVEVQYRERLGNNLFQYCFGRILAEHLGFRLKADPLRGFPGTLAEVKGEDHSSCPVQELKGHWVDFDALMDDRRPRKILLNGSFQRYDYYRGFKDLIRRDWLRMDTSSFYGIGPEDVLVYVRRGDYVENGNDLPFAYYAKAIEIARPNRVYLCTDDPCDPFFRYFRSYAPLFWHTPDDPLEDFRFIRSFNKIIQSQSTFSWWAAFLSKASEIYMPVPPTGYWSGGRTKVDLKVTEEPRYIYLDDPALYRKRLGEQWISAGPRFKGLTRRAGRKLTREAKQLMAIRGRL